MYSLDNIFSKDGIIANILPHYEIRIQQLEMAKYVETTIFNKKHLIIEAPTGIGKSLAYLTSAILMEMFPIIISTYTINLQSQLFEKEIPILQQIFPFNLSVILLKGRPNYICLRKIYNIQHYGLQVTLYNQKDIKKHLKLLKKIIPLNLGDKEKFPFNIPKNLWSEICSDSDTCLRQKCPFFKECYFYKIRKKLGSAKIIITNHSLFFKELLPLISEKAESYPVVIFDEAHHIPKVARDFFSISISDKRIKKIVRFINSLILNTNISQEKKLEIGQLIKAIENQSLTYFKKLHENLKNQKLEISLDDFINTDLHNIHSNLSSLYTKISSTKKETLMDYSENILNLINDISCFLDHDIDNYVFFSEKNSDFVEIKASIINTGELLSKNLFNKKKGFILTSATLSIDNNFDYFKSCVGLENFDVIEKILDSPFNFKKQSILYIPSKIPEITNNDFLKIASYTIEELLKITKGHAFILFTSYAMLNSFWDFMSDSLITNGLFPLKQGDLSREILIESFKNTQKSVLFGTDSFWEGVDIPGKALSMVIIMRIPFSVPDDPIKKREGTILREMGKNPFLDLALPEAILKLKQGIGRLIRNSNDKGILAILDKRIYTKSYGKKILSSLPDMKITQSIDEVKEFYYEKN